MSDAVCVSFCCPLRDERQLQKCQTATNVANVQPALPIRGHEPAHLAVKFSDQCLVWVDCRSVIIPMHARNEVARFDYACHSAASVCLPVTTDTGGKEQALSITSSSPPRSALMRFSAMAAYSGFNSMP